MHYMVLAQQQQGEGSGSHEVGVPCASLTGSALLLQKLPIMSEARRQLELDPRDAKAECNTLTYGPAVYALLALLRRCDAVQRATTENANKDDTAVGHTDGPFTGLNTALSYPQDRRWSNDLTSKFNAASVRARKALMVWFRRQTALLENAVALPTAREVLEPVFATLDTVLSSLHNASGMQQRRRREPGTTSSARSDSSSREDNDEEEDYSDDDDDDNLFGLGVYDRRGGGTLPDALGGTLSEAHAGRYGHNLAHLDHLCTEERVILAAIRRPLSPVPCVSTPAVPAAATGVQEREMGAVVMHGGGGRAQKEDLSPIAAASSAIPSSQWGPRMLALLRHGGSAVDHNDPGGDGGVTETVVPSGEAAAAVRRVGSGAVTVWSRGAATVSTRQRVASGAASAGTRGREERARVAAYLKRIAWIEQQGRAQAQKVTVVTQPGGQTSWHSLTDAERVQREMAHTHAQRQRFRRTRRHGGDGDDDDNTVAADDT